MTPPKPRVQSLTEADILHAKSNDLDKAFIELYNLYVNDIYRFCYSSLFYHSRLAEEATRSVFEKAYKYFHAFIPGQVSYRSYLFSLAATQLHRERKRMARGQHQIPHAMHKKLKKRDVHLWEALQYLDYTALTIIELWYGPKLSLSEISVVVNLDHNEVHRHHNEIVDRFQKTIPDFTKALTQFFVRRAKKISLSSSVTTRMNREIMEGRKTSPTFVRRAWWQSLLGPMPFGFVIGIIAVVTAMMWYVNKPQPIVPDEPEVQEAYILSAAEQRPQAVFVSGQLPNIELSKHSLSQPGEVLFGTDYTVERSTDVGQEDKLEPTISYDLPVSEYRSIERAYIYSVPEALDKEQLQLAAFRHFFSLPLNQFTYVNGTYYIDDANGEFQPLFIAFNNNGSVEFQMRQAAICGLEGLTDSYKDEDVRTGAFNFLRAHNFIEVEEAALRVIRISEDGRIIKKDAICKDGSTDSVQDREFVFFPGHVDVRYGGDASEVLPLRLRGITTQTHGNAVTSMRIDRLNTLREHMVRSAESDLISLEQAIAALNSFYYPSSDEREEYQRYLRSFAQWDHLHGEERLREIEITEVGLEYVFDSLNHRIEPYYVFSGNGTSDKGFDNEIRIYVVASTEELELRVPYRE